jgi:DNA (cytosine-5)-methyltransferase 1
VKILKTQGKVRVATVFSGIGSFEFALRRLHVAHEVIFACDNGNRNINIDSDKQLEIIKKINTVGEKLLYESNL